MIVFEDLDTDTNEAGRCELYGGSYLKTVRICCIRNHRVKCLQPATAGAHHRQSSEKARRFSTFSSSTVSSASGLSTAPSSRTVPSMGTFACRVIWRSWHLLARSCQTRCLGALRTGVQEYHRRVTSGLSQYATSMEAIHRSLIQ